MGYQAIRMDDDLIRLEDALGSSSYLLRGKERTLLIDTGWGDGEDLRRVVAELAEPPVDLVITHAHGDHYANAGIAGLFRTVFMHPDDLALLPEMNRLFAPELTGRALPPERVTPLPRGGLDLGGIRLEVLPLPGHTPGSVCLLERERNRLFTGDAMGSGGQLWMQLPHGLPIGRYAESLRRFLAALGTLRPTLLGGHYTQAGTAGEPGHRPVTLETVRDVLRVCEALVTESGGAQVVRPEAPYDSRFGGTAARLAVLGDVQMAFLPGRIL